MAKDLNKKEKRNVRRILTTLLLAFAIIAFWRGAWGLMDLYLFPKNLFLSFMISLLIGIIILYSTKNLVNRLI